MTTQEVFHACIEKEAQKYLPRVAQNHDKRHQRTPRASNLKVAEVGPVHLPLFARQATQT
jgi:hypothetical protein